MHHDVSSTEHTLEPGKYHTVGEQGDTAYQSDYYLNSRGGGGDLW